MVMVRSTWFADQPSISCVVGRMVSSQTLFPVLQGWTGRHSKKEGLLPCPLELLLFFEYFLNWSRGLNHVQ
jgi:hypothetical protein